MNELSVPEYSESDFVIYNSDGHLYVQHALTAIQDSRRSARTPIDMEHVLRRAEEALRRNLAEKALAKAKFSKARNRAAHHLRETSAKFDHGTL